MFVLSDTHVVNSNLVNIARFGLLRFDGLSAVQNPLSRSRSASGRRKALPAREPTSHR